MQLRAPFALPSFKPLSRSASPAPNPNGNVIDSGSGALTPPLSPPKGADRGRKSTELSAVPSPLASPALASVAALNGNGDEKRSRSLSRPLAKFSLGSSRSPTPVGTPVPSPKLGGTAVLPGVNVKGGVAAPSNANNDPSTNMEAVGLRISEAVTRALAGSSTAGEFKGRKGVARGTGTWLAETVFEEFPAPPIDQYVLRAILRVSVKHLSVFASRLETVLFPALIDPTFSHPVLFAPTPPNSIRSTTTSTQASPFNPCQTYCLSLAHAAFEARHAFGEKFASGPAVGAEAFPRFVADALKPVIEKLDSIVGRVILPLLAVLKRELLASLHPLAEADKAVSTPAKPKINGHHAEPVTPPCLVLFASKIDHARRALAKISFGCSEAGENWVVGIAVSTIWKGMVTLVDRPVHFDRASPRVAHKMLPLSSTAIGARSTSAEFIPKPLLSVKSTSNVATLLRPTPPSRPSSPPRLPADPATVVISTFEGLVVKLVEGLVPYVLPAAPDPGHLAREALAEAIEALQSLRIVVAALGSPHGLDDVLVGLEELKAASDESSTAPLKSTEQFLDALDDVPPILLFHLFNNRLSAILNGQPAIVRPPNVLFGWNKEQYDAKVLVGFGAAEEWEDKVGAAIKAEVERVEGDVSGDEERKWLKTLSLVVDVI